MLGIRELPTLLHLVQAVGGGLFDALRLRAVDVVVGDELFDGSVADVLVPSTSDETSAPIEAASRRTIACTGSSYPEGAGARSSSSSRAGISTGGNSTS